MKLLYSLFLLLVPLRLWGDQFNEGDSPSHKIHFEVRGKDENSKEIWLSPENHKEKAVKLCETEAWGNLEVHFSSDDFWIIVQDGGASLGIDLTLFQRVKGVTFKEIKDANIGDKAEHIALAQAGVPDEEGLDHRYIRVEYWTDDSRFVLVRLYGAGSNQGKYPLSVAAWYGFYDLGKGDFTFDFRKINEGSVVKNPKQTQ